MPDSKVQKAQKRLNSRGNGVGNFNGGGKVLGGKDIEFYKRDGRWRVRKRPQTTKDRNTLAKDGKDPEATGGKKAEFKKKAKLFGGDYFERAWGSPDLKKEDNITKGKYGSVDYKVEGLQAESKGSYAGEITEDGLEIKGDLGIKGVLVGGALQYKAPAIDFSLFGEACTVEFGVETTAEAAAEAKGELGVAVNTKETGVSLSGDLFAGGKAGVKAELKVKWKPKGEKAQDLVGGSLSIEGWAGLGIGGKVQIGLLPKIRANAYFAACVGIGGKVGGEVWMHAINAAKLGWVLAAKGIKAAIAGLKKYGAAIGRWVMDKAAGAYRVLRKALVDFMSWMNSDNQAYEVFKSGLFKFLTPKERGQLIYDMQSGYTGEQEQTAILGILEFSGKNGDLQTVVQSCRDGASGILWDLDWSQDTAARKLFRSNGIAF